MYNRDLRSNTMELASFLCGILALTSCTCLYLSFIGGSLAIIFAVLSNGGSDQMGDRAKIGFGFGLTALLLTAIVYISSIALLIASYGGVANFIHEIQSLTGQSYDAIYSNIYEHLMNFMELN